MKPFPWLAAWGFTPDWWRGRRGEYWVLAQAVLLLAFALLPARAFFPIPFPVYAFAHWGVAIACGACAIAIFGRALLDLGQSLTPLPHPRDDSQLVSTGIYAWVRHPIYVGVVLGAVAWAGWCASATHLLGAIALGIFFDAKARREEAWLLEKYPDYAAYAQCVRRFIPGVY